MSDIPDNAPSPRLSIIVKWPDFEGYGFNLHAEKSKPGQYIGKVDAGSPAEVAGLLEGDRIIEVNGVNIANENHKQVVQRIKAVANETRLLVLDPKADKYYKSKNIVVRGTQENVIVKTSARPEKVAAPPTPEPEPSPPTAVTNGHHHHHNSHHHDDDHDNRSVSSAASSSAASESSSSHLQAGSIPAHADEHHAPDGASEETSAAEPPKERCPTPLPEEGDDSSQDGEDDRPTQEDLPPPVEDEPSLDGEDRPLEEEARPLEEEARPLEEEVKPLDEGVAALQEGEGPPSEGESTPVEGNVASEKLSAAVEGETAASSPEPESDLEAEYDNVELAGGPGGAQVDGNVVPPAQPASTSRRSSSASSSAGSHSSRSSDTAHTDPSTQSVMSTSSTPPSSLEPAPAPVTAPAPTPAPAPVPAPTAAKPATKPLASNNTYNSSGLNLNMSAAEMRAMLARKKKADPRKDTVDLRKKYEIIQNM
ncbi:uncharacterized protein [Panulirus ornatus]|uniref:uncharacterized protein n=1 Tax=Panulirus ornatus TaxID=150431 RepID=UPI003A8C17D9